METPRGKLDLLIKYQQIYDIDSVGIWYVFLLEHRLQPCIGKMIFRAFLGSHAGAAFLQIYFAIFQCPAIHVA